MIAAIYALVLALVLAVAPHGEATCAWVLWEESTLAPLPMPRGSSTAGIVVVSAFESLKGCEAEQSAHLNRLRAEVEKRFSQDDLSILPGAIAFRFKEAEPAKAWGTKRFLCLPDNVDPRGPKGGTR